MRISLEQYYLIAKLIERYGKYMYLKVFIDSEDEQLKQKYDVYVKERREKMLSDIEHIDAGFDLFSPENCTATDSFKLNYRLICGAKIVEKDMEYNTGFYMYPRSSISKTGVRLANNVGIIDAGYRGHLIGAFDLAYRKENASVALYDRHLQICAPGLIPIVVELVSSREEVGEKTERGDGGFGSTGV